ncbi:MAG TPA: family 20 glycosylhydrolase [Chitinophaga sp.]|uniref:family 20 glycosylhydrolase n=1 Tax=Chitinophaga sp. TaxID=1869181 RepID=UPI002D0CF7C3|nr:family 20 glycosylhydrolase [Chitinophaga sp.]HVI47268.1 family 20 glycosylhydrolase [Chitinophaga sp.]
MKRKSIRPYLSIFPLLAAALLQFNTATAQRTVNDVPFTIPAVRTWQGDTGNYTLPAHVNILVATQDQAALQRHLTIFRNDLAERYPDLVVKVNVSDHPLPRKGDILFTLAANGTDSAEAYHMVIDSSIRISGQPKGCFWATRTMLQILEQSQERGIPRGSITDAPRWPVRGFVLDAGRKFFPMSFLRDYVQFMSYYKMSDFHIHLNDQGPRQFFHGNWDSTYSAFRLENSTYPALTAKDGHYTKAEFIALQEMADSFGVTIIPEIDVPAHSLAFTKLFPEIGSTKYGMDHLDLYSPKTYEVIDNVFKEYLQGPNPVFRGKEVHIGTDEYSKKESEQFRSFMNHYIDLVQQYGKQVRMWGSLTNNKGNTQVRVKGVTMNLWYNGYADPKEMLQLGYDAISTPDGWLYIVPAAGYYYDYLNARKLYDKWTPSIIGDQVFDESNAQIKGGSFAVWNDHVGNGITAKDVHDRVFPAMQVLAEKMWTGKEQRLSYDTFARHATAIGEGPGLNIRGKLNADSLLPLSGKLTFHKADAGNYKGRNAIRLKNAGSYVQTSNTGIGYNYTVSFYVWPEKGNKADAVLFSSPDAVVKLKQQQSNQLGFSREGYHYSFNYIVPEEKWTHIVIAGNNKGTTLYADGVMIEKLEGRVQQFPESKSKRAIVQTLFFPLQYIGGAGNSFKGYISDLKVYGKIIPAEKVHEL